MLGLLLAPTLAGSLLVVAATGAFLAQHPLSLLLADVRRGKRFPRTTMAAVFAAGYSLVALAAFVLALRFNTGGQFLTPLLLAAPLAAVQLWFDMRNRGRALTPELLGAAALGSLAAATALTGPWSLATALTVWLLLVLRSTPSILYVWARLVLERAHQRHRVPDQAEFLPLRRAALAAATTAALGTVVAAAAGWLPWLAALPFPLLLLRCWLGTSRWRKPRRAPVIGVLELAFGVGTALLIALAFLP